LGNETAREHFAEALACARQSDDRFTEGGVYNFLGLGQTLARNIEGRANAWRALQLLHEQGFTLGMTTALEVLAAQAGLHGRHAEAAQLAGAAQAQRNATGNTATTSTTPTIIACLTWRAARSTRPASPPPARPAER
jgi:hypothetical protein